MSTLRIPLARIRPGPVVLDADTAHYVTRVRRLTASNRFIAFDPESATEADARIIAAGRTGTQLELSDVRNASQRPVRPVTLLQGVGKGDKLDAVVRDATELGATLILPFIGARSIAHRTTEAAMGRLRRVALDAARQSGRGDLPRIVTPGPLLDALSAVDSDARFVLHPGAPKPLGARLEAIGPRTSVAVLIGPEGGLTDEEVTLAAAHGFDRAALGTLILRTETAATAALGAISAWTPA